MNQDIVVVDAESSGANESAAYGYDINQVVEQIYLWNLDTESSSPYEMQIVPMLKHHRTVVFHQAKKLGLVYVSAPKDKDEGLLSGLTLRKPRNYSPKVWPTPLGPDEKKKKKSYDKIPLGASEILDGFLWLGSGRDADDLDFLREKKISHVLNVTSEWHSSPEYRAMGIHLCRIDIKDFVTESIAKHFEIAFSFLDQCQSAGGIVLVHCVVGKSRSASVVLAYLMSRKRMPLLEAVNHVKQTRDIIRPNDNFLLELQRYETELFPELNGRPSLVHEDLPPMKDPHAQKKRNDELGHDFIRKYVTDQLLLDAMGDLDAIPKNRSKFESNVMRLLKQQRKQEIASMDGMSEKTLAKMVRKHVQPFFDAQMKQHLQ